MFRRKRKTKKDKIENNIERVEKAAGFVVDLKRGLNKQFYENESKEEAPQRPERKKEKRKKRSLLFVVLKVFSLLSFLSVLKEKNKKGVLDGSIGLDRIEDKKERKSKKEVKERLSELMIFNVLRGTYKICYTVGWFTVFFVRFSWILGYRTLRSLIFIASFAKRKFSFNCRKKIKETVFFFGGKIQTGIKFFRRKIKDTKDRSFKIIEKSFLSLRAIAGFAINAVGTVFGGTKSFFIRRISDIRETFLLCKKCILSISASSGEKIKNLGKQNREKKLQERIWEKNKVLEDIKNYKNNALRTIPVFAFLAVLMIIPFKAITYYESLQIDELKKEVLASTQQAAADLKEAGASISALNMDKAYSEFGEANINFSQAEDRIARINGVILDLAKFVPSQDAKMASMSRHLIDAGNLISETGAELTLAFEGIKKADKNEIIKAVDEFEEHGNKAVKNLQELNGVLEKIDSEALPEQYRGKVNVLKKEAGNLEDMLTELVGVTKELKILLGAEKDKNYLLVFQNNNEARATGGFIGSYALLEVSEGRIDNIEVPAGGSYDVRAGMREFYESPEPLHLVSSLWHFRDANWWPDWPTSAENLMKFYSDSGGPTTDGVISFTPTVLESVLDITGPISMEEDYGVTFTSKNCEETLRNIIEKEAGHVDPAKARRENRDVTEPKKIIGDLMDILVKKIGADFDRDKLIELIGATSDNLQEKQILFYFTDKELQKEIEKRGWGGEIKETDRDYLSVINTNIAGRKSDKKINQEIEHKATIKQDGSIVNEVKIKRHHTGDKNTPYYGERNVNWMRVYVPEGSEFMEAKGFDNRPDEVYFDSPENDWEKHSLVEKQQSSMKEMDSSKAKVYNTEIYDNANKTVIAGWSMLDPGESEIITLKYELPFKLVKEKKNKNKKKGFSEIAKEMISPEEKELYPYSLYIQKQPGIKTDSSTVKSEVIFSDRYSVIWNYPKGAENKEKKYEASLNSDQYWAVLLEKK
ncbi:MAG: DUF4012 domain-containing protein [Patescibacteria group bacterium]